MPPPSPTSVVDVTLTAITQAEDEDLAYRDIRDNNSRSNKTPAALKQFNVFLKGYCERKHHSAHTAEQLPYCGLATIHDVDFANPQPHQSWWNDLIGNFFNYLAFEAKNYRTKDKDLLGYESATGYASAVKSYFTNKFRDETPLVVFQDANWRKLRNLLATKYSERGKRTGQRISTPREASNGDDRKAMGKACFWLGTVDSAEFHGLNVWIYHLLGRGRDVAILKPEDVSVVCVDEDVHSYRLLEVSLQRDKDGPLQELNLYPHKTSVEEDPYFGLLYLLLFGGCKPELFPRFYVEALKVDSITKKSAPRVGTLWTRCFNTLYKEFKTLSETVSNKLTSYHGRKGANQKLAETSSVSGFAQIFRTGWELRGFHSVFDYVIGSKTLTNQAGKALSGWTTKRGDEILGGLPPTLTSVKTNPGLLGDFVHALFVEDFEELWPSSIRNLLVASLLRHYDEFVSIIKQHPEGIYTDTTRHPFVHAVNKACACVKVDTATFRDWCKEVREGFAIQNYMALPIGALSKDLSHNPKVDPRTLFEHVHQLGTSYNCLFAQKMVLEEDVANLRRETAQQTRCIERLEKEQQETRQVLAKVADLLEIQHGKCEATRKSPPPTDVLYFSDSMKKWRITFTLQESFVGYFRDKCLEGYELEKQSDDFKKKLSSEKSKIKGQYKRLKKAIKILLYFCDSYPKPIPDDPKGVSQWQRDISLQAEQAVKALEEALPDDRPKRLTIAYLQNCGKDWDNPDSPHSKLPPKDTPQAVRAHFGFKLEGRTSPVPV